jgi:anti-anti-sigma regulatory factor
MTRVLDLQKLTVSDSFGAGALGNSCTSSTSNCCNNAT